MSPERALQRELVDAFWGFRPRRSRMVEPQLGEPAPLAHHEPALLEPQDIPKALALSHDGRGQLVALRARSGKRVDLHRVRQADRETAPARGRGSSAPVRDRG